MIDLKNVKVGFWFAVGFFLFGLLVTGILRVMGAIGSG